eukprot:m.287876 g.287876  ORF g.287876 m.287876 type:complete len:335 (+) comp16368_c0_seq16:973-1977(+)
MSLSTLRADDATASYMKLNGTQATVTKSMVIGGDLDVLMTSKLYSGESLVTSGNVYVDKDSMIEGAKVTVQGLSGRMTIAGSLTHKQTNTKSQSLDLTVVGRLVVPLGGVITADGKSTLERHSSLSSTYRMSWGYCLGGYAGDPGTGAPCRGSVDNPDELGYGGISSGNIETSRSYRCGYLNRYTCYYKCSDMVVTSSSYRGGGRIKATVGTLSLDGRIEARGICSATGGTVNIQVSGGPVTGNGTIDVGVTSCSASKAMGSGGRVAISGFTFISTSILKNARADGSLASKGPAGTTFYRYGPSVTGSIIVRSIFPVSSSLKTCLTGNILRRAC